MVPIYTNFLGGKTATALQAVCGVFLSCVREAKFFFFSSLLLVLLPWWGHAQITPGSLNNFTTEWNTEGSTSITIPGSTGLGAYNYYVYWREVDNPSNNNSATMNTPITTAGNIISGLAQNTTYRIEIAGIFPSMRFNAPLTGLHPQAKKLKKILRWGNIQWKSLENAFGGAVDLDVLASDTPNLTSASNISLSGMFHQCSNLQGLNANWNWNTSNVINMAWMFYQATNFNRNISSWNVGNVTNMTYMFASATNFNQPIGAWNVSSVTNMVSMFQNATNFNQPIGAWNTSNVTTMASMFSGAINFNQPIETWNTSNVTTMTGMFNLATNFNRPIGNWSVGNVTNMANMFSLATNFNQPIGSWNVSSVTNMYQMFFSATNFNQPIGSWNVSSVTNMGYLFYSATNFNRPIGNWSVGNVTNMAYMFQNATNFNQPIGNWSVGNVTNMANMFTSAINFNQPIGNWNTAKVTDMQGMFYRASTFNQNINSWNTGLVTNMANMFREAIVFNQPIGNWNTSNVTNMSAMFRQASQFNQPIGTWNTSKVTNMTEMFYSALVFNQPIGNWNTSTVTNMSWMFYNARVFDQPIGAWNVSQVSTMADMFYYAWDFNQNIGNWNVSNVINMAFMFGQTYKFNQNLNLWNVSNVMNMENMFNSSTVFNGNIASWNVSQVTKMNGMFSSANQFNQNISTWNVINVESFQDMFYSAYEFNQNLGSWDIRNMTLASRMFNNTSMDCHNFSQTLIGWWNNPNTPSDIYLSGPVTGDEFYNPLTYNGQGAPARDSLINVKNWTINGTIQFNNISLSTIPGFINICVNSTQQLPNDPPTTSTNHAVWSSSDPTIASVNATGLASGIAPGSAIIDRKLVSGPGTNINGKPSFVYKERCFTMTSKNITVLPSPTVSLTAEDNITTICQGENVKLLASGADSYIWGSSSSGLLGNGTTKTVSPTSTTVYAVIGTIANGCTDTVGIQITVKPKPNVTLTSQGGVTTICEGNNVQLNASGATSYVWSGGILAGGGTTRIVSPTTTTTYNIKGTTNGCDSDIKSITITVNPLPDVTLNTLGNITTICEGGTVTLNATGATSYVWSGGGLTGGGTNKSVSPSTTTDYFVQGTTLGCQKTETIRIYVNPKPIVTLSSTNNITTICEGGSVELNAGGATSYVWAGGDLPAMTTGTQQILSPSTTTIYAIQGVSSLGCISLPAILTITVNPKPDITLTELTNTTTICQGDSVILTATPTSSVVSTYSWNGGSVTGGGTIKIVSPSTTTTYKVIGTTNLGCDSDERSITITVNPKPTVILFALPLTICEGENATLIVGGATSYSWSGGGLTGGGSIQNIAPSTTTIYKVTGTTLGCNSDEQSVTVNVNPKPPVTLTEQNNITSICVGDSVQLNASGATSYAWSGGGIAGNGTTQTVSPTTTTTYSVTGTNNDNCSATNSITIVVNNAPSVTLNATATIICEGDSVQLNASGATSYAWSGGGIAGTSTSQLVNPTTTTTYTVIGTNANNCTNKDSITISVNPKPTITLTEQNNLTTICLGDEVQLNASGAFVYSWSGGDLSGNGATKLVSPTNTTTYTVTGTDLNNCSNIQTITITLNPIVASFFSSDITDIDCYGQATGSATVTTSGGATPYTFLWDDPDAQTTQTANNLPAGTYSVTITDANNCTETTTVSIQQPDEILSANIISYTDTICYGSSNGAATVTASGGTSSYTYLWDDANVQTTETAINLPAGTYSVTVTDANNCSVTTSSIDIYETFTPNLTLNAPTSCSDSTYSVYAVSNGTITSSAGNIVGDSIINIPIGTNIIVTATIGQCSTSGTVISPASCPDPSDCTFPSLTTSNGICDGVNSGTYSVSFTINPPMATVTTSAGVVSGNIVSGIPIGTNVTLTAGNGACTVSVTRTSPENCINPCATSSLVGVSGVVCNGTTYTVNLVASAGVSINPSAGVLSGSSVINIPLGTNLTLTATASCGTQTVSVNSPASCIPCTEPQLTLNAPTSCTGSTYSIYAVSNGTITSSAGNVVGDSVVNIPIGINVVVTATDGGCSTSGAVISPASCPDPSDCTFPSLTTSNGICDGVNSGTYSVAFVVNPSTMVTASAGVVSGNIVSGIPIGTDVTLTAGSGSCTVSVTRTSPANCIDPCATSSLVGISGTVCNGTTYTVNLVASSGVSINPSAGTLSGSSVINIPLGTNLTLTATASCGTQSVSISSPASCVPCTEPQLTLNAPTSCTGSTYSIYAISNGNIVASAGNIVGDSIVNIPIGTDVVVTATDGGCSTSGTVISPASCPDPSDCTFPSLTTSNGICDGSGSLTYSIAFTINPTMTVTASAGTVSGNVVSGIPIGTDVTLTAGSGSCAVSVTRTSPANCIDPCATSSLVGISGMICNGATYTIHFVASPETTVNPSAGILSGYSITDIPLGTNVTITATLPGCSTPQTLFILGLSTSYCTDPAEKTPDEKFDIIRIPNAFSPNGDGKDDVFVIPNLPEGSAIYIYNNWGSLVYQSENYQNNWDGRCYECIFKGDGLPTSTYYYVLEINSTESLMPKKHTGFVYLSR